MLMLGIEAAGIRHYGGFRKRAEQCGQQGVSMSL
jgi:hypothetical protein